MSYKTVLKKQENGIGTLTLNAPEIFNGFSIELANETLQVLKEFEQDDSVRVIIINGNGPGFCAGGDLKSMMNYIENGDVAEDYFRPVLNTLGEVAITIRKMGKPVIASIHKAAAGAGFNFALACDFRIATESSVFVQSFVNLGIIPDMGGLYFLTEYLGPQKAIELAMLGTVLKADKAFEMGLVTKVVDNNNLEENTIQFAKKFVEGPPLSYKAVKEVIWEKSFKDFEAYLKMEAQKQIDAVNTDDFKEGARAFMEKRKAVFQGK